ncbi:hypothetical protein BC835DRAFT_1340061, partial [Cytidiella melzeri]
VVFTNNIETCVTLRPSAVHSSSPLLVDQLQLHLLARSPGGTFSTMVQHWLMKAEPDSRIVKGKDVHHRIQALA